MDEIARSPDDFASAFESSFARLQIRIEEACAGHRDWPSGVAAAIYAAFELASAEPDTADTLTNVALAAGPDGIARHRRLLAYVSSRLEAGRELRPEGLELPDSTEQALAGGLAGLVAERLARGRANDLPALAPQAIQFALTPYLGRPEAELVVAMAEPPGPEPGR